MFENSSMKFSKRTASRSVSWMKRLYAITAGIAANSPMAVATSASAMPGGHVRERRRLHVRETAERVHDPPDGTEQADVRD